MPKLIVTLDTGEVHEYPLNGDKLTLGRAEDNDVVIKDGSISGRHAEFIKDGNRYRVYDLGSTNGTRIDGLVAEGSPLEHNSQLILGYVMATYSTEEGIEQEKVQEIKEQERVEELKKTQKVVLAPPPETKSAEIELASNSALPVDFDTMSPFKDKDKEFDLVKNILLGASVLSILACLVVTILTFVKI